MHHLADALHADDKILILVIPPDQDWFEQIILWMKMIWLVENQRKRHPSLAAFTSEDFEKLHHVIDFFSMMTYDYSGPEGVFNAPVNWIEQCVSDVDPDSSLGSLLYNGHRLVSYRQYIGQILKDPLRSLTNQLA